MVLIFRAHLQYSIFIFAPQSVYLERVALRYSQLTPLALLRLCAAPGTKKYKDIMRDTKGLS